MNNKTILMSAALLPMIAVAQSNGTLANRLQVGKVIPNLTGKDMNGKSFNLSEYRGKVVVLDFFGFW
jgi:cytochrome oxidase Cu insertion factor (SCO1/SenC/PrrC family)